MPIDFRNRKNLAEAKLPLGDIPEKARAEDLPLSVWLTLSKVEKIVHNKI